MLLICSKFESHCLKIGPSAHWGKDGKRDLLRFSLVLDALGALGGVDDKQSDPWIQLS